MDDDSTIARDILPMVPTEQRSDFLRELGFYNQKKNHPLHVSIAAELRGRTDLSSKVLCEGIVMSLLQHIWERGWELRPVKRDAE